MAKMVADDDSCGMLKGSSSCGGLSRCCRCCAPPRSSIISAHAPIAALLAHPSIPLHRSVAAVGGDSRVHVALGLHRRAVSPSQGLLGLAGGLRARDHRGKVMSSRRKALARSRGVLGQVC